MQEMRLLRGYRRTYTHKPFSSFFFFFFISFSFFFYCTIPLYSLYLIEEGITGMREEMKKGFEELPERIARAMKEI